MSQESSVHFKLNIPTALKDRLSEAAERSGRSLTSEILTRLQASLSLADDHGLEFTYEAIQRMIIDLVKIETNPLEKRIGALEFRTRAADPSHY